MAFCKDTKDGLRFTKPAFWDNVYADDWNFTQVAQSIQLGAVHSA